MALTTNQLIVGMFNAASGGFKTNIDTYIANAGVNGVDAAADALLSQSPLGAQFLGQPLYSTDASFSAAVVSSLLPNLTATTMASVNAAVTGFWALNPSLTRSQLVVKLIEAVVAIPATDPLLGSAAASFNAKVALANAYVGTSTDIAVLMTVVGSTPATVTNFSLTLGQDNLVGSSGDDSFIARIYDNNNSAQSGDKIDGGAGNDYLSMDIGNSQAFAITLETTGVESVAIRAQAIPVDSNSNNLSENIVQIDAQRMVGVTTWESNNSRADVVIEDVRILDSQITKDITIAMVETDPGHVDYSVYFDQLSLRSNSNSTSTLNLRVIDTYAAAQGLDPLKDSPYGSFTFTATQNGVATVVTLASQAIQDAQTYPELAVAFQAALDAKFGAGAAIASVGADFSRIDSVTSKNVTGKTIVITAQAAIEFTTPAGSGWLANDVVPAISGLHTSYDTLSASSTDLVTSKVILDDVGRGSTGGDLVIGGLSVGNTSGSLGVQRFEIEVKDNSKLESINSTNNTLREVTIKNGVTSSLSNAYQTTVKDAGNLTVNGASGSKGGNVTNGGAVDGFGIAKNVSAPGAEAQIEGGYGFSDVRLIDANSMTGKLAFSAEVTSASIGKYLNLKDVQALPAGDNVAFTYTGGTNDDAMYVQLDAAAAGSRSTIMAGREDFTFTANGGTGNDAITMIMVKQDGTMNGGAQPWYNNQKLNANVFVNGGDGNDTIRTPGAGDIKIDAGAGNDTIYTDNTGSLGAVAKAGTSSGLAAIAYANAAAAELSAALAASALDNSLGGGYTSGTTGLASTSAAAKVAALDALDQLTPTGNTALPVIARATLVAATATAVASGALTFEEKIAIDLAYGGISAAGLVTPAIAIETAATYAGAVVVPGNVTQPELTAGDAVVAGILATARAAVAANDAAAVNEAYQAGLLNATQTAVVAANKAVNGVFEPSDGFTAGTAVKVAGMAALQAALVNGATAAQVVSAINTAVQNGTITSGAQAAAVATAAGAGAMDPVEAAAVVAQLSPLKNALDIANATAQATLADALAADVAAVNTAAAFAAADPVLAGAEAVLEDAVGSTEAAAAAQAASAELATANADLAAAQAIKAALLGLKAAVNVGALAADLSNALANADAAGVAAAAASAADGTGAVVDTISGATAALGALAPSATVAPGLTAADELAFDTGALGIYNAASVDSLVIANNVLVDKLAAIVADKTATVNATALASSIAAAAAASGTSNLDVAAPKAVFVFDTSNQLASYNRVTMDDRNLADLKSDVNNSYNLFNGDLTVTFKGLVSAVTVVASTGYKTSDLQVNQAIKAAINGDAVLSKLLVATDGPANTLVVTSLIDGKMVTGDLSVKMTAPVLSSLTVTDIAGAAAVYGTAATDVAVHAVLTASKAAFDTKGDYVTQFAESGAAGGNTTLTGAASKSSSDNTITGGTGDDVIVLGTTVGLDKMSSSNEKVVYAAPFGNDTIVNFSAAGMGIDTLDLTGLKGSGAVAFGSLTLDKSIVVAAETAANDTAAEIAALFTDSATAINHVYIAYDADNIGSVYTVADAAGVGAGSIVATLVGTIDLASTSWASLTAANFA